jgi:hypothetical protein
MKPGLWVTFVMAVAWATTGTQGAIVPVSRLSSISVDAAAGTDIGSDARQTTSFDPFLESVSDGAAHATGTASASAGQNSDPNNIFGGITTGGGAGTATSGAGTADALSTFIYTFQITEQDMLMRLSAAIGQTGAGDIRGSLLDVTGPGTDLTLYSAHRSALVSEGPITAIEDFVLLAGHTYEFSFVASSTAMGTTSYSAQLNPIPEPGVMAFLLPAAGLLMRRRQTRAHR